MATKTCPECLFEVDEKEAVCPDCGHVFQEYEDDGFEAVTEERHWTFGNTLIALLLTLLIVALGAFLYLNGLKWPYEDAKRYYEEEKTAYEQQVAEYQSLAAQASAANDVLDAKVNELQAVLNSGEEPMDPYTSASATALLQRVREIRVNPPVIQATLAPTPAKDDIFHAKEIRETGRIIDQQRFSLYQQVANLQIPDYSRAIEAIDSAYASLQDSIRQKKESEGVSKKLKELLDDYVNFMNGYMEFMTGYNRSDPDQIERAEKLQTTYVNYLKQLRAYDVNKLSETDRNYYNAVTESVSRMMKAMNLQEPEVVR